MQLVIISDTHCNQFELPEGDVLIHCGDHTFNGNKRETWEALNWLNNQSHKHKLFIAGNHEVGWEREYNQNAGRIWMIEEFTNLTYLHNTGVEIEGKYFWGSPVQPYFYDWAFQKMRGRELKEHWKLIPDNTDVLITHGPPYGFGDTNTHDNRFGDKDLLARVLEVRPTIHCYGHAHDGYGQWLFENTLFINAASLNEEYHVQNAPVVVEI